MKLLKLWWCMRMHRHLHEQYLIHGNGLLDSRCPKCKRRWLE